MSSDSTTADDAESIRNLVLHAWRADPTLDSSTLDARVDPGGNCVVLTGDVGTRSERVTAIEITDRIVPFMPVVDRIVVRPIVADPEEPDSVIRRRVALALWRVLPGASIAVSARDHVVTLEGSVATQEQRIRAHAAAARCIGVHFVVDRVRTPVS